MANDVRLSSMHNRKLCFVHFFIINDFNLLCKRELERKDLFEANFSSFLGNFNSACKRYSIEWFDVLFKAGVHVNRSEILSIIKMEL